MAALIAAMDADAQLEARRRAVETAVSRVHEARKSGASLYIADMDPDDFEPVLRDASDMLDHWLEGIREPTTDFRRRVSLAEGAFLALSEALLAYDPPRGAQLWRTLRATMTTRYIGVAGVEELLHIAFRVPDSPAVTALREELVRLEHCNTDQALFDLAAAAIYNGKTSWLDALIKADQSSVLAWRQKRGVVLKGFTVNNRLPVANAWPDGEIKTGYAELSRKSRRFAWVDACAHHWWRVYLAADDSNEAYAAWVLFLHSSDDRGWVWMQEDILAMSNASQYFRLKLSYSQLNRSKLKRFMRKRTDNLDRSFLNRKVFASVGPWGKAVSA